MNSKAVQFLEANQSGERSTFVDDAKWRQENASWLRRSRRVAYAIMDYMQAGGLSRNDVAEKLGVSPQYVSKILSGKVNFSFKTISEIEEGLGIELFGRFRWFEYISRSYAKGTNLLSTLHSVFPWNRHCVQGHRL